MSDYVPDAFSLVDFNVQDDQWFFDDFLASFPIEEHSSSHSADPQPWADHPGQPPPKQMQLSEKFQASQPIPPLGNETSGLLMPANHLVARNTDCPERPARLESVLYSTDERAVIEARGLSQTNAINVADGNDIAHAAVGNGYSLACIECGEEFLSQSRLRSHANEAQHSPFACKCGQKFARLDVLQRHIESQGSATPKHPCPYCKLHRGRHGFRRRDHLLQHIRGYHKLDADDILLRLKPRQTRNHEVLFCRHADCEYHRDDTFKNLPWVAQFKNQPFRNKSDHTRHMKDVHNETPFPCNVAGCERVGSKGYSREKDLMRHRVEKHPGSEIYTPGKRQARKACPAGCGDLVDPNNVRSHVDHYCEKLKKACPKGCGRLLLPHQIDMHVESNCKKPYDQCPNCGCHCSPAQMSFHLELCQSFAQLLTRGCGYDTYSVHAQTASSTPSF